MKPALALLALALSCAPLSAQSSTPKLEFPTASPPATLKQRVGVTDIEVHYSRPSVKGRKIFGGLVPYGQVWRTGANQATRISFSTPVKLNGTDIAAGNYELFTIPNENEWTVIVHKAMSQWGAYTYDEKNDVARVQAKPVQVAAPIESFAIGINDLRDESATLYLAWERTRVPLKVEVDAVKSLVPQIEATMASDSDKKPYAQAALFYLEHDLDLDKAAAWMDAAIAAQPGAFYFDHYKARILAKKGDKAGAIAAATKSLEAARKAEGGIRDEYVRLNEELLAKLK